MPTYEYKCEACGNHFDELQGFSDEPLTKCPKCKKKKLKRLFGTGAAVLFKGSGFYQTDYRSESYKAGEKQATEAAKPAASAESATKSDTKTETATAAKMAAPAKSSKTDKGSD